jgi:hypothetical protein
MKRLIGTLFIGLLILQSLSAEALVNIELQKNSSITINGSTNLINFQLNQSGENLPNRNFTLSGNQVQNKFILGEHTIALAVKRFTSDNIMALRDFLKLIKAKEFPTIQIHILSLETTAEIEKEQSGKAMACVNLCITGVNKQYLTPIDTKHSGDQFRLKGTKHINIRDFGLTPPSGMLGLLKVSEWIDIHFDIQCKINTVKIVAVK